MRSVDHESIAGKWSGVVGLLTVDISNDMFISYLLGITLAKLRLL